MNSFNFLEFIENTNKAESNEELFHTLRHSLVQFGYDLVTYSLLSSHDSFGLKAEDGILQDCPEGWFEYYFGKGYQHIDPRVLFGRKHNMPFYWQDIKKHTALSKKGEQVLNEANEAGLYAGIGIPIHGHLNELAGVSLASSYKDVKKDHHLLSLMYCMMHQFHLSYCTLNKKSIPQQDCVHLTARETEVLKWCGFGKSNWDISKILSISEHGVEYHLRNIYRKLNVNTRIGAVSNALRRGYIDC